jgi:hypothetical protein
MPADAFEGEHVLPKIIRQFFDMQGRARRHHPRSFHQPGSPRPSSTGRPSLLYAGWQCLEVKSLVRPNTSNRDPHETPALRDLLRHLAGRDRAALAREGKLRDFGSPSEVICEAMRGWLKREQQPATLGAALAHGCAPAEVDPAEEGEALAQLANGSVRPCS